MADKRIKSRCVIIAGSPDVDIDFIKSQITENDYVICADKGYSYALMAGVIPDVVVGDFDSCSEKVSSNYEIIRLNQHKDDTDTMHSIDLALERGYKNICILGATGGRFDHTFSNVSALSHIYNCGGNGIILSRQEQIQFLPKGEYQYSNQNGKTFSLFPFGCGNVCVSYTGVEYPLNKYRLQSSIPMGVSNVFTQDNATISIYDGNAILIINLSENKG